MLGDFEGPHTRRWLRVFVERGHDVHAISYYPVRASLPGVTLHVLSDGTVRPSVEEADPHPQPTLPRTGEGAYEKVGGGASSWLGLFRRGGVATDVLRLLHALRYRRAGLRRTLDAIQPDVFHAHFAVEHGFYGAFAGWHPYVVSAWGSDLLLAPRTKIGRRIATYALSHADLVTVQDPSMVPRAVDLGAPEADVHVVRLGIDGLFFEDIERSVNVRGGDDPPTVLSDRALEPLYNVHVILRAFALLRERLPDARLVIAHEGSERVRLEGMSRELGLSESVRFAGRLGPDELHEALLESHVYVSVPGSDAFSLSNMEAMASGAFPVVSALPSVEGMIRSGENGLRVPDGDVGALSEALYRALNDGELRRSAVAKNRGLVAAEGRLEDNMLAMERHYYRLAGHPVGGAEAI